MKTLIDLFSGCGGLSLGLEQAGFTIAFASDIDPVSCETYKFNRKHLDSKNLFVGDIKRLIHKKDLLKQFENKIDLVSGGPPCQGFSMANRQRIIDDPRNVLYKYYLEFLKLIKPKFFLIENVKGMSNKIGEILSDIGNLLGGDYNVSYAILNAKDFGVPQNRERLFIIGNCIGVSSEKIINEIKNTSRDIRQFNLYDAIGDLPQLCTNPAKNNTKNENDRCGYFQRKYVYAKTEFYRYINGERNIDFLYNHKSRYNNDRDIKIFTLLPQGANSLHPSIKDLMPYSSRSHIFKDKYFKLKYDDVCKTITSHMKHDCNMYVHPTQARGLSPREAARIQTFPDDFVFCGYQNSWYKQIGNAVPVKLAKIIGEVIYKCL